MHIPGDPQSVQLRNATTTGLCIDLVTSACGWDWVVDLAQISWVVDLAQISWVVDLVQMSWAVLNLA